MVRGKELHPLEPVPTCTGRCSIDDTPMASRHSEQAAIFSDDVGDRTRPRHPRSDVVDQHGIRRLSHPSPLHPNTPETWALAKSLKDAISRGDCNRRRDRGSASDS